MRKKKPWREFVATLTEKQKDSILYQMLERQIDDLGCDGEVCFREAYDYGPDDRGSADIYWNSCGDSLIYDDR